MNTNEIINKINSLEERVKFLEGTVTSLLETKDDTNADVESGDKSEE